MTDDISKVVAEMRTTPNAFGWSNRTVLQWADRIESATTPVEVGAECAEFVNMVGDEFGNEAGVRLRELFATLTRQLVEAKEGEAMQKSQVRYWFNATGGANTRAEQAESQLAEATRRVAEVEGLVLEAVSHMKRGKAYYSEYHDFIERHAALTKEPTK